MKKIKTSRYVQKIEGAFVAFVYEQDDGKWGWLLRPVAPVLACGSNLKAPAAAIKEADAALHKSNGALPASMPLDGQVWVWQFKGPGMCATVPANALK